ncbi:MULTISPECIES: proline iminopeptidase-family hydrolase [Arthrobacter]|uniref:proline iminopeptidase-family hydrolase n=1 Tax=unclassified Arthrobacter TaxID=235627 RepID=UPI0024BA82DA|nr:proline iminopeptidase-family hydrolase [Arthrobacter sp. H35-MC1]MDJ0315798.1 proline iminopeptidase-family hydrolase [Arthrobacter sp. H35-MC1]
MSQVTTRTIPFRSYETWVRITTPDVPVEGALPLIVLHGGPGMAHDYVRSIAELAETGRTVILYDQLGCGNSTHLPDAPTDFWTPQLFVDEFVNLVQELQISSFHLLGQSWGGMLGAEIAVRQPDGLTSLAICNSPASMELWAQAASGLRSELPLEVQQTLIQHEEAGTTQKPEYLAAVEEFYRRHVCRLDPVPQDFRDSEKQMEADPTVYYTMNGPNEFHVIGTLRRWSIIDQLADIQVPTLVFAGEHDEATAATWQPYADRIKDSRVYVFPDTSHCVHLEDPEGFRAVIGDFLSEHDKATSA